MSQLVTFDDAVIADLTTNVARLATAKTHRHATWTPERLVADKNLHLSVAPAGDIEVVPIAAEVHEHYVPFLIQVWENAQEGSRARANETVAAAFLQLYEDVRDRFYLITNETNAASGAEQVWMVGGSFPTDIDQAHYFDIVIRASFPIGFH